MSREAPLNEGQCPKCGHHGAEVEYHRLQPLQASDLERKNVPWGKETMRCTCGCCGYEWTEKPLDKAPKAEIAEKAVD